MLVLPAVLAAHLDIYCLCVLLLCSLSSLTRIYFPGSTMAIPPPQSLLLRDLAFVVVGALLVSVLIRVSSVKPVENPLTAAPRHWSQ